jgi:hypothetical protein
MDKPTNPESELLDRDLAQALREQGAISHFVAADLSSLSTVDAAKFLAPLDATEPHGPRHRRILAYQRLLRIEPDRALAEKLVREELYSAGQIASIPVDDFLDRHLSAFDNDRARARRFHAKAATRRTQTSLQYHDLKARSGAHYRKGLAAAKTAQLKASVGDVPNYDQLFGGQDYVSVPDARTVFSPAAYFVDLMWVISNHITQPSNALALSARRPDLQNIRLDSNNTDVEVPYLDIVDYALEQRFIGGLASAVNADAADETVDNVIKDTWAPRQTVYDVLNLLVFPFGLPFDLALRESHGYIELLGTSRAEIARTFFPVAKGWWPAEVLGLSRHEVDLLTKAATDPTPYFGGKSVPELATVDVFLAQTGLSANELDQLLYQDLGVDERPVESGNNPGKTPHGKTPANVNFFINGNSWTNPGFIFVPNTTDVPTLKYCCVDGTERPLSAQDLDRLNRFIRLARKLGWSFADLDWVLQSTCGGVIDQGAVLNIARIKTLQARYRLPVVELCALWSNIKPTGMGAGPTPNDLFDRTFNDPGARKGEPPFRPKADQAYYYWYSPVFQDTTYSRPDWDSWLRMGLGVSKDDLQRIRQYLNIQPDDFTPTSISECYQASRTAQVMGLTIDELVILSKLVGTPDILQGNPNLEFVWRLAEVLQWLKGIGLSAYRLDFLANRTFSTEVPRAHTFVEMYDFYVKLRADLSADFQSAMKPSAVAAIIVDYLAQYFDAGTWKAIKPYVADLIDDLVMDVEWYLLGMIREIVAWVEQYLDGGDDPIDKLLVDIEWYLTAPIEEFVAWLKRYLGEGDDLIEELIKEIEAYLIGLIRKFIAWVGPYLREVCGAIEELIKEIDAYLSWLIEKIIHWHLNRRDDSIAERTGHKVADQGAGQTDSKDPETLARRLLAALRDKRAASHGPDDGLPTSVDRLLDAITAAPVSQAEARLGAAPTTKSIIDAIWTDYGRYVAFRASEPARLQASLSGFWGVPAWATEDFSPHVEASVQAPSLVDFVFGTLSPAAPTEAAFADSGILVFFDEFQRCASLAAWPGLSRKQAALVFDGTAADGGPGGALELDYIRRVFTLVQLSRAFRDSNDTLVDLLQGNSFPLPAAAITSLQAITGWGEDNEINTALTWFPPDQKPLAGVAVLAQVKACFDLANRTKVSVLELPGLLAPDGLGRLAKAVRAKIGAEAWEVAKQQLARKNNPARRDALVGVAISTLQQEPETAYIKTRRDLHEYLLMDVEMSGEAPPTSLLRNAISSLQLYLYRCMTGLEPGASVSPEAKLWWEWMKSYRVWEANRKVFVYPENYALPSVRKNRTPLFDQLQKELHQTNITAATIETAYKNYLNGFAEVASLRTAGACTGIDSVTGQTILYQFGVTASQPYRHYWRSARFWADNDLAVGWSSWQAFNVVINSQEVSPVFAFGKLFVFWMERTEKDYSSLEDSDGKPLSEAKVKTTKTSEIKIRYVQQDFHGRWSAPQDLGKPVPAAPDLRVNLKVYYSEADDCIRICLISEPLISLPLDGNPDNLGYLKETTATVSGTATYPVGGPPTGQSQALSFDGSSTYIQLSNNVTMPSNYTIKFWVYCSSSSYSGSTEMGFICKYPSSTNSPPSPSTDFFTEFFIGITGMADTSGAIAFFSGNESNDNWKFFGTSPQISSAWTHVVIVVSKSIIRIYANGERQADAQSMSAGPATVSNGPIVIGYYNNYFQGQMADVTIQSVVSAFDLNKALACREASTLDFPPECRYWIGKAGLVYGYGGLPLLGQVPASTRLIAVTGDPNMCILDTGTDELLFVAQHGLTSAKPRVACTRLKGSSVHTLSRILLENGIDGLLSLATQQTKETPFSVYQPNVANLAPPLPSDFLDFNGANGIYYWEVFFHIPRLIAHAFNTQQQFESADRWYNYIFDPTQADNPVFYCPLHGDCRNIGSNGVTVSPQDNGGGTQLTYVADWRGIPNSALYFSADGGLPYLRTDSTFALPGDFTATAWVRVDSESGGGFEGGQIILEDNNDLWISATSSAQAGPVSVLAVAWSEDGPPPSNVTIDFWHHVGITANQKVSRLYIDGVKVATYDTSAGGGSDPSHFSIGGVGGVAFCGGAISDVAIFDQALSDKEMLRLYSSGVSTSWRFRPFVYAPIASLKAELTDPAALKAYKDDPLDPHAIARLRPVAYEKATVMDYVDNLLDWGDALFRQYTRETVAEALKLYVTADDVLGRRPTDLGAADLPAPPLSYQDLQAKYVLGDLLDLLENQGGNGGTCPVALVDTPNNHIAGPLMGAPSDPPANWVASAYFELPENQQFVARFDRVEDRLYKIRHGLNIQGVRQPLPPYQPSVNPNQLPGGIAGGHGVPAYHSPPVPPPPAPYRYRVIVEKAKEFTSTVMQFGASLLAALEKRDAAHLQRLQQTHAQSLLELTLSIKKAQVDAAIQRTATLQAGLDSAKGRQTYYDNLIANDFLAGEATGLPVTPEGLAAQATAMEATSLALAAPAVEATSLALTADGLLAQVTAVAIRTAAIPTYLIPTIYGFSDGGFYPGSSVAEGASVVELGANILFQGASVATTMGGFLRRRQDWQFQAQLAGDDITQLNAQLVEAATATTIAQRDYGVLVTQIAQANEVESVLKSMFTNEELYQWMVSRLSGIYLHAYQLALDLARQAEASFKYEVPSASGTYGPKPMFITGGYWDDLHKGLCAAEGLMLDLMRMEKAYVDRDFRRLEIQKTISLKGLDNGKWLNELKKNGVCTFKMIDESILDVDFPGHVNRRIKSLSLSLPALIGPYQDIHATLTRTEDAYASTESIVLSRGLNDAGLFELRLDDPRYLPFEGRDFDCHWTLEMRPHSNPELDYDSLSDVIINLSYTAMQGPKPKSTTFEGGVAIDLSRQYPRQWDDFRNHGKPLSFEIAESLFRKHLEKIQLKAIAVCFEGCTSTEIANYTLDISGSGDNPIPDDDGAWRKLYAFKDTPRDFVGPQTWVLARRGNEVSSNMPKRIILVIDYRGDIVWAS